MARVECPSCGAVADVQELRAVAEDFCSSCDFPLFWAQPPQTLARFTEEGEDDGLAGSVRRQPGAGGRQMLDGERCPVCHELNLASAVLCQRCGAEMHPKPLPPPPAPVQRVVVPVAVPVQVENSRPSWMIWVIAILCGVLFVQFVLLILFVVLDVHLDWLPG